MTIDRRRAGQTSDNFKVMQAFDAALSLEDAARTAWLRKLKKSDPDLAVRVLDLLEQDRTAYELIPTAPPSQGQGGWSEQPARVGAYRVVSLLGLGGMGAVWLGERDDGLFEQTVAIKLVRPGLISPGAAAQFAGERRLLAKLRHPNIAQLFDGGADEAGRAYFVMELVEGEPINDYVTHQALSPREAARLLLPVCAAVQHAHQALVVHADIKPGNILVDAEGRPKLLDFGIARSLHDLGEDAPGVGFTQGYASPERQDGEPPSPPGDVYALGVVLYELVSGQRAPEQGPPPRGRQAPGPRQLDAELDAVIAKATAARPQDRYDSVGALSEDIRRWVEKKPVRAIPITWPRAVKKLFERRPLIMASAVTGGVLLIGAFTAVTTLYVADKHARAVAEDRFDDVRGMARYLLFDVYDKLARTPRALPVRRDVAAVGQRYLDRLALDASASKDLRLEAAEGLLRLALIQGGGHGRNLGQTAEAMKNLDRAMVIAQQVASQDNRSARALGLLARAKLEAAIIGADKEADPKTSEQRLQDSRAALDKALAIKPGDPDLQLLQVDWRLQLSALRQWQERYPESIAAAKQAMADLGRLPPALRASVDGQIRTARAEDALAETTYYTGDETGALAPYTRQREILEAVYRADPANPDRARALVRARWALGTTLLTLERAQAALRELDPGVELARAQAAFDPDDVQAQRSLRVILLARAQGLSVAGRHDESIAAMGEIVAMRRKLFEAAPKSPEAERDVAVALAALADIQITAHRKPDACAVYAQALTAFEDMRVKSWLTPFDANYSKARVDTSVKTNCR